jgi:hypothetical protein
MLSRFAKRFFEESVEKRDAGKKPGKSGPLKTFS